MNDLPEPLTPADCDLRDFAFMPLDIVRLFGSEFHALATDGEWRAGVTLWLKSFHQVPAASLPAEDVQLARLAELGRDVSTWREIRNGALRGWIQCSDGRLYHPVVAEKANEAWRRKLAQREKSRKGNEARWGNRGGDAPPAPAPAPAPKPAQAPKSPPSPPAIPVGLPVAIPVGLPDAIPVGLPQRSQGIGIERERETHPARAGASEMERVDWKAWMDESDAAAAGSPAPAPAPQVGTHAGRICRLVKTLGMQNVNPGNADLLALIAAGCTDEEFEGATRSAVEKRKGFAYMLAMLVNQRTEAAEKLSAMHRGALPGVTQEDPGRVAVTQTADYLQQQDSHRTAAKSESAQAARAETRRRLQALQSLKTGVVP